MKPIYQPIVLKHAENIIEAFNESGFFEDYEIEDKSYAMDYLCDKLTDKFILGELNEDVDDYVFTEDEMEKMLREIIAGTYLTELQEKGLIDSIQDANEEERFFLTDLGKEWAEKINKEKE
jgi:predicted transcriptional regulator